MSISGVSKSSYSPPKKIFTDPVDWGGNGPDILASLSESIANSRKSDPTAWTQISVPKKATPGATKTVPYGSQIALKRTVAEAADTATAAQKAKPYDAGMIARNSGRIAVIGQLGANDAQDTYKITLNSSGPLNLYAPNPDYNSQVPGSKISQGDARYDVYDSKGKMIASSDTRDGQAFSNWISLTTEGLGGLKVDKGTYTVKITRDNPPSNLAVAVNSKGEIDFTGTVFDDLSKIDASLSNQIPLVLKNSDGAKYNATFQLVKKTEGGPVPTTTSTATPDPKAGQLGGPDIWELQLINLSPVDAKNGAKPTTPPTTAAPVLLGTFTVNKAVGSATPAAATFTGSGATVAISDGSTLSIPSSGILPGDMKISSDGAKTVKESMKVNYSFFAVMGDPGRTTFYTVKSTPLTAAEQKKADEAAAVAAAKKSAKQGSSGSILSLFS
jgi:hypothetical protein